MVVVEVVAVAAVEEDKMKQMIFILALLLLITACSSSPTGQVTNNADVVSIPISDLSEEVSFYEHKVGSVTIRYFAVKGTDGEVRTAFDACDVCGGSKGYKQQGTDIVCNNCGRVFDIDGLGTENKGYGCWPSYLPHTVKGDNILINVKDIVDGRHRFV